MPWKRMQNQGLWTLNSSALVINSYSVTFMNNHEHWSSTSSEHFDIFDIFTSSFNKLGLLKAIKSLAGDRPSVSGLSRCFAGSGPHPRVGLQGWTVSTTWRSAFRAPRSGQFVKVKESRLMKQWKKTPPFSGLQVINQKSYGQWDSWLALSCYS